MWVVYTALKYLYRGCTPCASSSPEIKSTDDAKALVLFAHKYGINSLMDACENYLVELAEGDMSDDGAEDFCLFINCAAIASWTELADACNLDTLLAHCELAMIRDTDMTLWCDPATTSGKISRSSLFRMLRASQQFICRAKLSQLGRFRLQAKYGSQRMVPAVSHSYSGADPDHHVNIATLMQWRREMQ
ncbi:hypothetical protein WJX77_009456 [Trebouxia sp. C0004]